MDAVKIADAGSHFLISGAERETVQAALAGLVAKGARVIAEPAQLGSKWIASCEKPPANAERKDMPATLLEHIAADAVLKGVKVANAGSHLLLTAADKSTLESALQQYVKRGARVISAVAPLGNQWVASCGNPDEPEESCAIERMGFQIMVSGASEKAVRNKVESLAFGGAKLASLEQRLRMPR